MNEFPHTGWIVFPLRAAPGNPRFIPRGQTTTPSLPPIVSMRLGSQLEKKVRIDPPRTPSNLDMKWPARLRKIKHGKYKAGPLVAILTSSGSGGFCGNLSNFSDLIRTGRRMGVTVYVLTPDGLRPGTKTVRGFLLNPRTKGPRWVAATLPLPDVVYNRIPSRRQEMRQAEQRALSTLSTMPGIHLFNPSFFNKWTLYLHMGRSEALSRLLPETVEWKGGSRLDEMIERHSTLFLKPVDGKAGDGMIRITRLKKGYGIVHQSLRGKQKFHISDDKLRSKLKELTGDQSYILQQGIHLARYRGRPFDLRLLLQKDGTGQWDVTGIGVRVAGGEAISTHVPMGGSIAPIDEVFNSLFGNHTSTVKEHLRSTVLEIARHIEKEEGKNLGEMSMDLGLEPNGRIWFFEANAKPMKFDEPAIRQKSLRRLIEYCLYLSGYTRRS